MRRGSAALSLALLLLVLRGTPLSAQSDSTTVSAERTAGAWLKLLDDGRFEGAWQQVVPAMRGAITYDRWATSLRALRASLPAGRNRTLAHVEKSIVLFGGPAVILTFRNRDWPAREIIVLVRTGGGWLVGGYGVVR